ncbi:MAG: PilX N-terminal domain-containing pilus assembly protein [Desulfatiglandales bacterium]
MKYRLNCIKTEIRAREEGGFVLVLTLMIMMLLLMIGIFATTSTNLELQIATADRNHTVAFYNAEAGLEIASALLEENISCPEGFSGTADRMIGPVQVYNSSLAFWVNDTPEDDDVLAFLNDPAGEADFAVASAYPWAFPDPNSVTSIRVGGRVSYVPGAALQMAAGYVGLGKAAAAGGSVLLYDIYSHHLGLQNSSTTLHLQWRHVVGQEGPCRDAEL